MPAPPIDATGIVPRTAAPPEVLRAALGAVERGERVVLATVLRRRGSAPATPGQKLALLADATAVGTVGGGAVERRVIDTMLAAHRRGLGEPRIERYDLGPTIGMCCGGGVEIVIEVLEPSFEVVVVGAGHIGMALAPVLAGVGFRVTLCDSRDGFAEETRVSGSSFTLLHADHDDPEVTAALGPGRERAALVVMTHDHQLDQQVIEWAVRAGFGFVGGVGSRAKAARTRQRLESKGFAARDIERVEMPLGLDIGARAPGEIAIAIAARLVKWRAALLPRERSRHARAATVSVDDDRLEHAP
jgi:xanthine dehydrogenase accessory factor